MTDKELTEAVNADIKDFRDRHTPCVPIDFTGNEIRIKQTLLSYSRNKASYLIWYIRKMCHVTHSYHGPVRRGIKYIKLKITPRQEFINGLEMEKRNRG